VSAPSPDIGSPQSVQTATWDGSTPEELARAWAVPRVETWTRITSTNDRALALGIAGAGVGTTVVADEQTAGRGRRGARWHSAPGAGLWMSVVVAPGHADPRLPLLVGVACAEAIEAADERIHVGVKWPNDLVIGARKVGGILVERASGQAVVGIGINVKQPAGGFSEGLGGHATALEVEGVRSLMRKDLATLVITRILERLERPGPFSAALSDLAARDALAGRRIVTEEAGPGVARGVDSSGALLLERPDGTRVRVIAGRVRLADIESASDGELTHPSESLDGFLPQEDGDAAGRGRR
jgi:BirA family transcriptional regulator, biotin operon repressor / biotin---[acetyl-CoA-carboxylase] ligase